MILNSCNEGCGWIAALIGCLGMGSFGVPLKGKASNQVDGGKGADPFVLQTYKSTMFFIVSWFTLPLGATFHLSPWGLVSGILWVTGGISGIYGIRNAGLAISVGCWSGVTVLVSFIWGIFIFGERVQSKMKTIMSISLMILGFIGMTYFSSPSVSHANNKSKKGNNTTTLEDITYDTKELDELLSESLLAEYPSETGEFTDAYRNDRSIDKGYEKYKKIMGYKINIRTLGIIGAAADGILGGSMLVPMHYSGYIGLEYVISFSVGAMVITICGWILRLLYNSLHHNSLEKGYKSLPSMYIKQLGIPGAVAGTLWSIGNLGTIESITYLGESIGMSIVQSQLIISGLWGILWFGEIKGFKCIVGWISSALLTLFSIILMTKEHVNDNQVGSPYLVPFPG